MKSLNYDLIRYPIITEKAMLMSETHGKYVFCVRKDATKHSVAELIESLFNVKVVGVNIINQIGKLKKFKSTVGKRSDVKKAIVTLAKGQTLDVSGGVQ